MSLLDHLRNLCKVGGDQVTRTINATDSMSAVACEGINPNHFNWIHQRFQQGRFGP